MECYEGPTTCRRPLPLESSSLWEPSIPPYVDAYYEGLEVKPLRGAYEVVVDGARLRVKLRSLRVGDYRVIYWYDPLRGAAWLILAGHRESVYKLL